MDVLCYAELGVRSARCSQIAYINLNGQITVSLRKPHSARFCSNTRHALHMHRTANHESAWACITYLMPRNASIAPTTTTKPTI